MTYTPSDYRAAGVRAVKCTARTHAGKPCKMWAARGATVCKMHGGAAPQVKAAARRRLEQATDASGREAARHRLGRRRIRSGQVGRHPGRAGPRGRFSQDRGERRGRYAGLRRGVRRPRVDTGHLGSRGAPGDQHRAHRRPIAACTERRRRTHRRSWCGGYPTRLWMPRWSTRHRYSPGPECTASPAPLPAGHEQRRVRRPAAGGVVLLFFEYVAAQPGIRSRINLEAGGGDDHRRRYAVAVGEDHTVGFDRLHGGDDLDAAGSHGVDELVGQRGDAACLFHHRLQPERRTVEATGRQVTPHQALGQADNRIDRARGRPGEGLEEDIRWKRSDGTPHEMRRCADRKPNPARAVVGELDGVVGGRIAGADNEDVAVAEGPSVSEVAGVHELAGEVAQAWPGRDGRGAVVARGEDDYPRSDFARRCVESPAASGAVDPVDLTA